MALEFLGGAIAENLRPPKGRYSAIAEQLKSVMQTQLALSAEDRTRDWQGKIAEYNAKKAMEIKAVDEGLLTPTLGPKDPQAAADIGQRLAEPGPKSGQALSTEDYYKYQESEKVRKQGLQAELEALPQTVTGLTKATTGTGTSKREVAAQKEKRAAITAAINDAKKMIKGRAGGVEPEGQDFIDTFKQVWPKMAKEYGITGFSADDALGITGGGGAISTRFQWENLSPVIAAIKGWNKGKQKATQANSQAQNMTQQIQDARASGYTDEQIRSYLIGLGATEDDVDKLMELV